MRAKDFMMREEITIMADRTMDERIIPFMEPRTGGLPVADDKNDWIDFVKRLNIVARRPMSWHIDPRNMDRMSASQGSIRMRQGQ